MKQVVLETGELFRGSSAAALLIAQGVYSRTVMETLGHSDIRVTMNTYGHVFEAAKHEAAAKMDALLAGGA